jgi:formiminotetrahydrofolate cyclodeaminase
MNINGTIKNYLDELSSNSPTPGGGNVSALCGALAASLGIMVCSLTIGKKKYYEVETEMMKLRNKLGIYKEHFIELAGKDNEAFSEVMEAYRLPKETETEQTKRSIKIEEATLKAAKIPAEVINYCNEVIPFIKTIAEKGNKNSVSDAGVAALLVCTGAEGAYLNVLINCSSLKNNFEAPEILRKSKSNVGNIKSETSLIIKKIIDRLKS